MLRKKAAPTATSCLGCRIQAYALTEAQTTLRAALKTKLSGIQFPGLRYLRPAEEMAALFQDIPQAIAEARELSSWLQFEMKDILG